MGHRIDWHGEPDAPAVNSIKPSAAAFIQDQGGRVLLIQRDDNQNWSMPGGAMDPGESLTGCAIRETAEEAGVSVEVVGLVGIYTDPEHRVEYTSDGEVRQEFTVVYRCRYVSGDPRTSSESTRVEWVPASSISTLRMDRSQSARIKDALRGGPPRLDPT